MGQGGLWLLLASFGGCIWGSDGGRLWTGHFRLSILFVKLRSLFGIMRKDMFYLQCLISISWALCRMFNLTDAVGSLDELSQGHHMLAEVQHVEIRWLVAHQLGYLHLVR